jgi:soluble lytic murein transglycosylase-like protein
MSAPLRQTRLLAIALLGSLAVAAPARAELVFFNTGRSMSVKSHRIDGDSMIIALRSGGEATFDRSLVARIEPDEVPYPEPEVRPKPDPAAATEAPVAPYGELIDKMAAAQGVDAKLVKALIQVESAYQPRAKSKKGAMGLMQLMPETARQYAVADPYDVRSNIEAGIKHLKSLLDRFPRPLALAAYNAGEASVLRFGGVPPYAETTSYVSRILKIAGR